MRASTDGIQLVTALDESSSPATGSLSERELRDCEINVGCPNGYQL
jgi:hypothetical protein